MALKWPQNGRFGQVWEMIPGRSGTFPGTIRAFQALSRPTFDPPGPRLAENRGNGPKWPDLGPVTLRGLFGRKQAQIRRKRGESAKFRKIGHFGGIVRQPLRKRGSCGSAAHAAWVGFGSS